MAVEQRPYWVQYLDSDGLARQDGPHATANAAEHAAAQLQAKGYKIVSFVRAEVQRGFLGPC